MSGTTTNGSAGSARLTTQMVYCWLVEAGGRNPERDAAIFGARAWATPQPTFDALAVRYGVTKERVRQVELAVLRVVRARIDTLPEESRPLRVGERLYQLLTSSRGLFGDDSLSYQGARFASATTSRALWSIGDEAQEVCSREGYAGMVAWAEANAYGDIHDYWLTAKNWRPESRRADVPWDAYFALAWLSDREDIMNGFLAACAQRWVTPTLTQFFDYVERRGLRPYLPNRKRPLVNGGRKNDEGNWA